MYIPGVKQAPSPWYEGCGCVGSRQERYLASTRRVEYRQVTNTWGEGLIGICVYRGRVLYVFVYIGGDFYTYL
jgi:hypothetical protein